MVLLLLLVVVLLLLVVVVVVVVVVLLPLLPATLALPLLNMSVVVNLTCDTLLTKAEALGLASNSFTDSRLRQFSESAGFGVTRVCSVMDSTSL